MAYRLRQLLGRKWKVAAATGMPQRLSTERAVARSPSIPLTLTLDYRAPATAGQRSPSLVLSASVSAMGYLADDVRGTTR